MNDTGPDAVPHLAAGLAQRAHLDAALGLAQFDRGAGRNQAATGQGFGGAGRESSCGDEDQGPEDEDSVGRPWRGIHEIASGPEGS